MTAPFREICWAPAILLLRLAVTPAPLGTPEVQLPIVCQSYVVPATVGIQVDCAEAAEIANRELPARMRKELRRAVGFMGRPEKRWIFGESEAEKWMRTIDWGNCYLPRRQAQLKNAVEAVF